jgi:hypothetical protein
MATATELTGVVPEHVRAVNDFDADATVATCAGDAYVSDARREIRGVDAIRRWVNKANVTIEPIEVIDHDGDTIVRGRCDGANDKSDLPDELPMSNYFSDRDGNIVSLAVSRNQPSESHQTAE